MAAIAKSDASVSILNGLPGFGIHRTRSDVTSFLNSWNAFCCSSVHNQLVLPVNFVSGLAILVNPFTNLQ
jgi:hypothetical protein